ncbi:MAG: hypothetical protein GY944_11755 [bacterium]|nr:hypothetical protein [bacterium]
MRIYSITGIAVLLSILGACNIGPTPEEWAEWSVARNYQLETDGMFSSTFKGPIGGPFQSSESTVRLSNVGPSSLNYVVDSTESWLHVGGQSPTGMLASQEEASCHLAINTGHAPSQAGTFVARLEIRNAITLVVVRQIMVVLVVEPKGATK